MSSLIVAKYLRVSNEDQGRRQPDKLESNSITNQRNLLTEFLCQMPELQEAEVLEFCDDGWSGKNFERPAVKELLGQVRQGKIQCIIVKDISRFGRDYLTVGNYLSRVFPFLGVRFIAVNDGFDSTRPTDIDSLETSFKTLLYDLYSRDLSRKIKSTRRFQAERGDFLSPFAPYGYIKNPSNHRQLSIDIEAAQVVHRIFKMAAEGHRTLQIARILNEEQIPTPMQYKRAANCSRTFWNCVREDNFWTHTAVTAILRDERYIGKNIYGKRMREEIGKAHTVSVEQANWIIVENTHEGIVTKQEFERAQEQLRKYVERDTALPGKKGTVLYKKVRCGICGHIMTRNRSKQPYYSCKTHRVTEAYICMKEPIPESDLIETVLTGLRMQVYYAVKVSQIWKERQHNKTVEREKRYQQISRLKEICTRLENMIQELYENFVLGKMEKEAYLVAKSNATKKREEVTRKIEKLQAELQNITADRKRENSFLDHFSLYIEVEKLTKEIATDVLREIVVYPDHQLHLVWNYQEDFKRLLFDGEEGET